MLGCVAEASQRNGCGFAKWITRQNLNGPDKTPFSPPIHLDAVSHLGLWPGRWSRTRRSEHIDPHWSPRVYRSRCPEHERQKMPMSALDGLPGRRAALRLRLAAMGGQDGILRQHALRCRPIPIRPRGRIDPSDWESFLSRNLRLPNERP